MFGKSEERMKKTRSQKREERRRREQLQMNAEDEEGTELDMEQGPGENPQASELVWTGMSWMCRQLT